MSIIKLDIRDGEFKAALKRMKRAGKDLSPVFRKLRKPLADEILEHAERGEGPDGPWPALASSTIERDKHKGRGKRTANRSGSRSSLGILPATSRVQLIKRRHLAISNKVDWAYAHNEGATTGRGQTTPARPFAFLSPAFLEHADDLIVEYLTKKFGAGQ